VIKEPGKTLITSHLIQQLLSAAAGLGLICASGEPPEDSNAELAPERKRIPAESERLFAYPRTIKIL
jgi:hypothetical protein